MMIDLRRKRIAVQCSCGGTTAILTYREGQGDLLVTKCFKVSQTLQARFGMGQFLLGSITFTMKCKRISSLKCVDFASETHPYD